MIPPRSARTEPFAETVGEHERPAHVDVDLLEMRVDVEVPERSDDGERGVVDEEADVEVDEFGEDSVEVVAVGEVCSQRARLHPARGGDVVGDLLCELDAPCDEHDVEPAVGAPSRERLAESFRCPGDNRPRAVAICERCHR